MQESVGVNDKWSHPSGRNRHPCFGSSAGAREKLEPRKLEIGALFYGLLAGDDFIAYLFIYSMYISSYYSSFFYNCFYYLQFL
jgi:hypothetical protein